MADFDQIERTREMNEGVHPAPAIASDEEGDFAVIVDRPLVGEYGETYTHSQMSSLRAALGVADSVRRHMASGDAAHMVDVYVVDKNDESRGALGWEDLG